MKYNSFYGGRQGASFVIQQSYKRIYAPDADNEFWNKIIRRDLGLEEGAEISEQNRIEWNNKNCMVPAFKLGNGYKAVNYDEYVIIDTENKNDLDNGKVYCRGYDYNNDMGGALYVGQIVGPDGLAPHTEIKTLNEVLSIEEQEEFDYRKGKGEYSVTNDSIVPGKAEDGTFNDSIKWAYCSVRYPDSHESTAYIGFKVPYTVIDYSAKSISAYETASITRLDNKEHPFYEQWELTVPKGIKGDAIKNLYEKDDAEGKRALYYKTINYDNVETGEESSDIFIGHLNDIKQVNIDANGKITIQYSAQDSNEFQLRYPSTLEYNEDTNKLHVKYTAQDEFGEIEKDIGVEIKFITRMEINPVDYNLYVYYNTQENPERLGSVKSDSGILIGENFVDPTKDNIQDWIDFLNVKYPDGRPDGKIVTAGSESSNKGFYAFNYNQVDGKYVGWYYLGTIGSAALSAVAAPEEEGERPPSIAQELPLNGLWFVIEK